MIGRKDDKGKVDYTLIPPNAIREVAEALTYGAEKYSAHNWVNVDPCRYLAAAYRHIEAFRTGYKVDMESRLHHLSHAITNLLFLLERDLCPTGIVGEPYVSYSDCVKKSA